jgi:GT2 family glycosyltransferase
MHSQDIVTAVIVAHDGAAWLPRVAQAVANQTRPVQRVVAVDTGSRDRSGAMLAQAFGRAAVFGMERTTGYGAAVAKALRHRAANTHIAPSPGGREERTEWVWLLHDDCEPAPDALERLLAGAAEAPSAAVLGPKVRDWSDREVLLEAGLTIDRAGRRVTGIEPREADQGQHDGDRDVLAVSSAGMLARRDVWDDLGGFDPGMRLFREDTDFCWRVNEAGYKVRVVTAAVVYHVEASARNRREPSAAPRPRRQDRRNALLVLAGNLPARPMLSALAGNLVLSTMRTIFFLLAKRPGAALDELAAYASVPGHPLRLWSARRQRAAGRQAAYSRLGPANLPPGRSFRMLGEYAIDILSKSQRAEAVGSHHASEDPSDDDSLLVDSGLVQRMLTNPGVLLFAGLTVVALVAERALLGGTPLGGGALVPAWGGVSGLWQEYLQGFHTVSIGTAASTPPYVAVIAVLATLLGGKPWLAVDLILLGCVPLAGLSAFLATRRVTRFVPARIVGALAYALLPVGIGAVGTGRLGTAVLLVLLPPVGVLAGRVFTGSRRRARRAAWAMALLVAIVAAFVPLFWLITVVAVAVGVLTLGRGRLEVALNALIVAVVPVVLLVPWVLDLATHPARIFLEAGVARPGLATPGLPARSLLLMSPGGPGLPPYWVTAGMVLAAAAALGLAIGRRAPLVLAGWVVAVTGLITAALVSHIAITQAGPAGAVGVWPGPALAVAGAGLLLAVVAAGDRMAGQVQAAGWRSVAGLAVLGLGVLACSAPAVAAAYWVSSGVTGPVRPVTGPLLPEFVSVSAQTGLRLRTLVLQTAPGGGISYAVLRDGDPLIGSQELPLPASAQRALNVCVATLTAPAGGSAEDQGRALAGFGIGYVLLPAPIDGGLARRLDGVAGLRPVSVTGQFDLWRVADTTAQVTVDESGGRVIAVPSGPVTVDGAKAPAAGGTLTLAAPAGGWSASLNGHPLTPLAAPVNGWAQGFRLPPGGGSLTVSRSETGREAVVGFQVLAVLVVIGLGLPGARVAGEAEKEAAGSAEDELPDSEEELAPAGGRSARRRSSRRGRAAPDFAPEAEVPSPAAPVTSRLRGAVPAGVRIGWPRRGGSPAEAESPFADEPVYAGGPGRPDVPRQPDADDLAAQTTVLSARGAGRGRHGHRADGGQPAGDPGDEAGRRSEEFAMPGRRRRPGSDPEPPPRGGGYTDPRLDPGGDLAAAQTAFIGSVPDARDSGGPAGPDAGFGRGVPEERGGYPEPRYDAGRPPAQGPADPGDYGAPRRGFGRRAAPAPGPGGQGDEPGPRRGFGRRAGPVRGAGGGAPGGMPPGGSAVGGSVVGGSVVGGRDGYPGQDSADLAGPVLAPGGPGDYPDARRGGGRRAAHASGARYDYPDTRQDSGAGQQAPFGGGREDYPMPARGGPSGEPGRFGRARRGSGSHQRGGRSPEPAGELPRRPSPRGGPPGEEELAPLSPLPPLPPRAPRRARWDEGDPHSDGAPAELGGGSREGWDHAPDDRWDHAPDDRWDHAPDDQWDRQRRDERDEPDW